MKILYDHQIFAAQKFGGISRYFYEIMKIEQEGFQVATISPALFEPEPVKEIIIKNDLLTRGSRFLKRRMGINDTKGHEGVPVSLFPPAVTEIFRQSDYDIFHPTYYDPYFLEINKKPFVLTVYDMIHEIFKEYLLEDPASHNKLILCQKASQIIAISQKTKDDLVNIFGIPEEKVHAIPLASTFDAVVPEKPAGFIEGEKYILFVGKRGGYKNFYFPVIALTELLKSDRTLKILCTGHPFSEPEIKFFQEQGIEKQLSHIYLHNDNELAYAYRHAALFMFPSLYEGFGFPVLEAFASNCPLITSTGGSLPEVAGDAALYFDPKNLVQIRDAASAVLYDDALRKELVLKGRERFNAFSWGKCRKQTVEVYKQVLHS